MKVAKTIESVRLLVKQARRAGPPVGETSGRTIGLVPTMGALHEGHISLIKRSVKNGDFVVVSIFVNPMQFGPKEDFSKYPRPIQADLKICKEQGVDVVFAPSAEEIYKGGPSTALGTGTVTCVDVEKLSEPMCGEFRRGHFRGVATVCAKLFNIVCPDFAYFGQKDAQQAAIIKRMVADLNFPLKIVVCPTVRAADGLALSSRNKYLSAEERQDATCIYRALKAGKEMIRGGTRSPKTIVGKMRKIISDSPALTGIDYISIVDADTLQGLNRIAGRVLIAVAIRMGKTRLIDNIIVDAGG
ncbi:MAG: pantoate--beta-alanine ligase [Sedimentisphaerales bacterium]